MFLDSARAVADWAPGRLLKQGLLYPLQSNILETEIKTAARVAKLVFDKGLARVDRPADMEAFIRAHVYKPGTRRSSDEDGEGQGFSRNGEPAPGPGHAREAAMSGAGKSTIGGAVAFASRGRDEPASPRNRVWLSWFVGYADRILRRLTNSGNRAEYNQKVVLDLADLGSRMRALNPLSCRR